MHTRASLALGISLLTQAWHYWLHSLTTYRIDVPPTELQSAWYGLLSCHDTALIHPVSGAALYQQPCH